MTTEEVRRKPRRRPGHPPVYRSGDLNRQKVYQFIIEYTQKNGHSPSVRDIAKATGLSHNGAHLCVQGLIKLGLLERIPHRHRSIIIKGGG